MTAAPAWSITWPDGTVNSGPSATAILQALAADQPIWNPAPAPDTATMKRRISERAWAAHRADVDESLPDDEFLRACAKHGLFRLADTPPPNPRTPHRG